MIWYIAQLDSTVTNNTVALESLEAFDDTALIEAIEDFDNRLDDIEKKQAIIENEMRSIMSDHSSFNEVLKDLGSRVDMEILGSMAIMVTDNGS